MWYDVFTVDLKVDSEFVLREPGPLDVARVKCASRRVKNMFVPLTV